MSRVSSSVSSPGALWTYILAFIAGIACTTIFHSLGAQHTAQPRLGKGAVIAAHSPASPIVQAPVLASRSTGASPAIVAAAAALIVDAEKKAEKLVKYGGTVYGGWSTVPTMIPDQPIIYDYGLGMDISWPLHMIKTKHAQVWGFDVTTESVKYLTAEEAAGRIPAEFHWVKQLLGKSNEPVRLTIPEKDGFASFGAADKVANNRGKYVEFPAQTLTSAMAANGHDVIDILKLDVEGAEFDVIKHWQQSEFAAEAMLPACQLLVEHHQRFYPEDGAQRMADMKSALRFLGFVPIVQEQEQLWVNVKHPLCVKQLEQVQ